MEQDRVTDLHHDQHESPAFRKSTARLLESCARDCRSENGDDYAPSLAVRDMSRTAMSAAPHGACLRSRELCDDGEMVRRSDATGVLFDQGPSSRCEHVVDAATWGGGRKGRGFARQPDETLRVA